MTKGNWSLFGALLTLGLVLPACSQMPSEGGDGMPVSDVPVASEGVPVADAETPAESAPTEMVGIVEPAPPPSPEPPRKVKRAKPAVKEEETVVASTAWQEPHGALAETMPMPSVDPVTETELQAAEPVPAEPMQAQVGIGDFLRRHLLAVIAALGFGAVAIWVFFFRRRKEETRRYG